MKIEAVFNSIQKRIISELEKATNYIHIAVAWFTDYELLIILESALDKGLEVKIILANDEINKGIYSLDFESYLMKGGVLLFGGGTGNGQKLMHNKFCIIDGKVLITGSYNWSKRARNNHENITIICNGPQVIQEFIFEFQSMLHIYGNGEQTNDNLVYSHVLDLKEYIDSNVIRLKNMVLIREYQLVNLEQTKIEIFKKIKAFEDKHDKELGKIILDILYYRKVKVQKDSLKGFASSSESKEASEKFENYKNTFDNNIRRIKNSSKKDLSSDELEALKKYYREATFICHPDKVSKDFKNIAEKVFNDLNQAYKNNETDKVKAILNGLKSGVWDLGKKIENLTEVDLLNSRSEILRLKIKQLERKINELKNSDTYKKIEAIEDWNSYFEEQKIKLMSHLELLKN